MTVSVVFIATMFMYILDSTVVNVALPTLRSDFRTSTASVSSVVTGYLVTLAVAMPAAAWLGDRFGPKKVLLSALAVFTAASALCGLATSLPELIAFRAVQGAAGGLSLPVGSAMLFRTFPPDERIRATRILMGPTLIAPALGPVVGGLLVGQLSWRWIFYVNLPVGIGALVYGLLVLAPVAEEPPGRFDLPGFLLAGTGFPLAMYALTDGAASGWGSPPIIVACCAAVVLLAAFTRRSLRSGAPLLRLALLGNRAYRTANLVLVTGGAAFLGVLFLVPLFLQNGLGFTPLHSGLSTFTEALGGIAGIQISSRLFPRTGPRPLMAGGLFGAACFIGVMSLVGPSAASWAMPVLMLGTGAAFGFAMAPGQATSLATISRAQTAQATTMTSVLRQAGGALGVALVATCLAAMHPLRTDLTGYHAAFAIAAGVMVCGTCVALRVRKSDALAAMTPTEPAESLAALPSDERIPNGVADHAESAGAAGYRHKEDKDGFANRASGLRVDGDGRAPPGAVEGDHVPAGAVYGGAEVACRARHHGPGDTTLSHGEPARIDVDGPAPGVAVERQRVPLAVKGNAESGRCARHRLQVAARGDGGWFAPGGAVEGEHVRAVVDDGAKGCARTGNRAQLVARIYGRSGTPGGPVEGEGVGAVVDGGAKARRRARYRCHARRSGIVDARRGTPRAAIEHEGG